MHFEFDHLFICTDVGALAANHLVSLGVSEGSANVHLGQGTANRRFFFQNAMLEFLWVHNELETRSELIGSTYLWERWSERAYGACPFGLCLRSRDRSSVAFPHWDFCPPYLPVGSTIAVGENSSILTEPMLFQTPFGQRPDRFPQNKAQPIEHPIGHREITRVTLRSPERSPPSPAWQAVLDTGQVQLAFGPKFSIELGFDREVCGRRADFHAELPLVLCW